MWLLESTASTFTTWTFRSLSPYFYPVCLQRANMMANSQHTSLCRCTQRPHSPSTLALTIQHRFVKWQADDPKDIRHDPMTWWTIFRNAVRELKADPTTYAEVLEDESVSPKIVDAFKKYDEITGTYWPVTWKTLVCGISRTDRPILTDLYNLWTRTTCRLLVLT